MNEKPKRRWFQLHLITAIVTVVVFVGILRSNTQEHWISTPWTDSGEKAAAISHDNQIHSAQVWQSNARKFYGWPFQFWTWNKFSAQCQFEDGYVAPHSRGTTLRNNTNEEEIRNAIIANGLIGLAIVCATALLLELIIRRWMKYFHS
jgi:hypothetical protein